ncbi:MAG: sirohydrochlorin cobaltochelatase [Ruthenibacterium lactatiformans]
MRRCSPPICCTALNTISSKRTRRRLRGASPGWPWGGPLPRTAKACALAGCMVRRFGQPEDGALVLLGHGTEHFASMVYPAMQTALRLAGGRRAYMGTVEGWPGFDGCWRS